MVKGLEVFRNRFDGLEDCYVLIGGTACDLWMGARGLEFRSTQDLDIVLAFEDERPDFVARLWDFVKAGQYAGYQAGETPSNFYRFQSARTAGFPKSLELCAKRPMHVPTDLKIARISAQSGSDDSNSIPTGPLPIAAAQMQPHAEFFESQREAYPVKSTEHFSCVASIIGVEKSSSPATAESMKIPWFK